jgi:ferredoxin
LSFDLILNIPKLKTHELTLITCGIKNMFGCVPGLHKVNYHLDAPSPEEFSGALVDLFEKIKPALTIVDAVTAMEGQGPANGELRDLGLILASKDTVALDAVCSKITGFEPLDILTTKIAYQRGLGEADLEKIEICGADLPVFKDFKHPSGVTSILNKMPAPLGNLIRPVVNLIRLRPRINKKICTKCSICVNSCPVKAIDGKTFKINKNQCIMCLCCRELCKYGAVDLKENILWKIAKQLKKFLKY